MATKDQKLQAFLTKAQAREDRARASRIARIKRAVAQASFYDSELAELEPIVFAAFGRTKLKG